MKNIKYLKNTSFLLFVMIVCGGFFFLTSASSVKKSNSQTLTKLSADLATMNAEIVALEESETALSSYPMLGEIAAFGFNFAPRGWAQCNGQLLPITQNEALFSLLGTTYGGDGRTTFALPDLRGRTAIHEGNGPGLTGRRMGARFGQERTQITTSKVNAGSAVGRGDVLVISNILDQINIMQPSLTINYCIALDGTYPSRS